MGTVHPTILSLEQLKIELDAGKSVPTIAKEYDLNVRTVKRKKVILQRKLQPISPACPEGFVVNRITTQVDADGSVKTQSMRAGPEPEEGAADDLLPDGMFLKGLSTLTNGSGEITAQWTIARRDMEQQKQAIETAIRVLAEGLPPLPLLPAPGALSPRAADLLNL